MRILSLTTIPPRLPRLGPVLAALLAQRPAPDGVLLCLPEHWDRFPGDWTLPELPDGVRVMRGGADLGPAMKIMPAARKLAGQDVDLIACDDDWLPEPGWAEALVTAARSKPGCAVTGHGFQVARLKRRGGVETPRAVERGPGFVDVAQGYAGLLVRPDWLADADPPPAPIRAVDDIWLSGVLAAQGVPIWQADGARALLKPAYADDHGLQDSTERAALNQAAAGEVHRRFGIWPPN